MEYLKPIVYEENYRKINLIILVLFYELASFKKD